MKPAEVYILNQPENYRDIIMNLQIIIEREFPDAILLFKWKIPYYYLNQKPFCFINASHKGNYVDVAFNKGYELKTNLEVLNGKKRNTFKSLRYFSLHDIDIKILEEVLHEAFSLH